MRLTIKKKGGNNGTEKVPQWTEKAPQRTFKNASIPWSHWCNSDNLKCGWSNPNVFAVYLADHDAICNAAAYVYTLLVQTVRYRAIIFSINAGWSQWTLTFSSHLMTAVTNVSSFFWVKCNVLSSHFLISSFLLLEWPLRGYLLGSNCHVST